MDGILETKLLCKSVSIGEQKQNILCNMNVSVNEGDFAIIMGASGAGKSTLLYLLSGMDRPTDGEVLFKGKVISNLSNNKLATFRRENCGFVFQQSNLNVSMSVLDNVLVNGYLVNKKRKEVRKRAEELLLEVGLKEIHFNKFPNHLSGGEAQRVAIVRAIINNPKIVFADEPTGALNSSNTTDVLNLFSKLNADGQTIITVTHDVKTAIRGNRIFYVKDGVIKNELKMPRFNLQDMEKRILELQKFLNDMGW
jgi:putative ABC transport system ATP-binding protein